MSEIIKIGHSFNMGDLVVSMAAFQELYRKTGKKVRVYQRIGLLAFYYETQVNSTTDGMGNSVCMNDYTFSMIKPLVEAQEYIESFVEWKGEEVDLNYDLTRDSRALPLPHGTLHSWGEAVFPETSCDLSQKWVSVEKQSIKKDYFKNKVIINRTQRYTNPYITYYFLKKHEDKIIFSGTDTEHAIFCSQWNLEVEKLQVDNFYQLAQVISWCKFGVFNQSVNFHISDAMKKPRVLELCASFPNTFVTGANGYQFYRQAALEFYFNKLINE